MLCSVTVEQGQEIISGSVKTTGLYEKHMEDMGYTYDDLNYDITVHDIASFFVDEESITCVIRRNGADITENIYTYDLNLSLNQVGICTLNVKDGSIFAEDDVIEVYFDLDIFGEIRFFRGWIDKINYDSSKRGQVVCSDILRLFRDSNITKDIAFWDPRLANNHYSADFVSKRVIPEITKDLDLEGVSGDLDILQAALKRETSFFNANRLSVLQQFFEERNYAFYVDYVSGSLELVDVNKRLNFGEVFNVGKINDYTVNLDRKAYTGILVEYNKSIIDPDSFLKRREFEPSTVSTYGWYNPDVPWDRDTKFREISRIVTTRYSISEWGWYNPDVPWDDYNKFRRIRRERYNQTIINDFIIRGVVSTYGWYNPDVPWDDYNKFRKVGEERYSYNLRKNMVEENLSTYGWYNPDVPWDDYNKFRRIRRERKRTFFDDDMRITQIRIENYGWYNPNLPWDDYNKFRKVGEERNIYNFTTKTIVKTISGWVNGDFNIIKKEMEIGREFDFYINVPKIKLITESGEFLYGEPENPLRINTSYISTSRQAERLAEWKAKTEIRGKRVQLDINKVIPIVFPGTFIENEHIDNKMFVNSINLNFSVQDARALTTINGIELGWE